MTHPIISSGYGVPHDRFQRQQSMLTQLCEWEERAEPYRGWSKDLIWGLVFGVALVPFSMGLWTVFHAALGAM
jgi:MFS superfamily sulfate permease-like transporter